MVRACSVQILGVKQQNLDPYFPGSVNSTSAFDLPIYLGWASENEAFGRRRHTA